MKIQRKHKIAVKDLRTRKDVKGGTSGHSNPTTHGNSPTTHGNSPTVSKPQPTSGGINPSSIGSVLT